MQTIRLATFTCAATLAGMTWGAAALAQEFPVKPIRLIVPFAPGGGTDITGRTISAKMADTLKQPVIVENRTGAGGVIGAEFVAKAAPDGYTVLIGTPAEIAILPHMQKMPYDPLRDFAPVSLATSSPLILVTHPSLPVKSAKDLITLARTRPGLLTFGSAGTGGVHHLAAELLKFAYKLDMVHVPYKGVGAVIPDLVGGHISMTFSSMPPSMPFVASGKLRAVGIAAPKRSAAAPEVPTLSEVGAPDLFVSNWFAYFLPAATPPTIVGRLSSEINRTLKMPDVREKLLALGLETLGTTPEELGRFVREESEKYGKTIKAAGIKLD
jgi:tripartite-type tricarboxylate transporter receptor subunit TctC